jgi:hypothetical protein
MSCLLCAAPEVYALGIYVPKQGTSVPLASGKRAVVVYGVCETCAAMGADAVAALGEVRLGVS